MTEPARTHHERVVGHLREATKHFGITRKKVEDSLQAHLDAHPLTIAQPTVKESDSATQDSN